MTKCEKCYNTAKYKAWQKKSEIMIPLCTNCFFEGNHSGYAISFVRDGSK